MFQAKLEVTADQSTKSTPLLVNGRGRPIDPRLLALGQAMISIIEGIDALRPALQSLEIEPDAIVEEIWGAYYRISDKIDAALEGGNRRH